MPVAPAVAVLAVALAGAAAADPGDLDPAFNGGAPVLLDLAASPASATGLHAAHVDGAGRVVVAGFALDADGRLAAALARLGPDGSPDPDFGTGGKTVTQAGRGSGEVFSMLASILPRPGGGWIGTGGASAADGRQAALALAVDEDGDLDLGFGSGGSTRVQAAGPAPQFTLAFAGGGHGGVDAGGNVVIGHSIALDPSTPGDTRVAVVKLGPTGAPAAGFGSPAGVYTNGFSQTPAVSTNYGWAALPTPDGILLAGSALDAAGQGALLLVRLTEAGALDGGFAGGAGYRVVQASDPGAPPGYSSQGTALAVGGDGAVYVAGSASDGNGNSALLVACFDPGGTLDPGFGDGGVARVQTGTADPEEDPASFANGIAIQPDGRVLVIGSSGSPNYTEIVVVRLTSAGAADPTFGTGGVVRIQPSTVSEPETFGLGGAVAPDGATLVVVGQMRQTAGGRGVVARIQLTTPSSTTTTTLPDPCAPPESAADALCRLRALGTLVATGAPAGKLRDRLVATAGKAESRLADGAALAGRARRKKLKQVLRLVARFASIATSRRGRSALGAEQLVTIEAATDAIARIVGALRAAS